LGDSCCGQQPAANSLALAVFPFYLATEAKLDTDLYIYIMRDGAAQDPSATAALPVAGAPQGPKKEVATNTLNAR